MNDCIFTVEFRDKYTALGVIVMGMRLGVDTFHSDEYIGMHKGCTIGSPVDMPGQQKSVCKYF